MNLCLGAGVLWAQTDGNQTIPLNRLDGPTRAKVLAALAGLAILGLGMMALTWLGARVTRRYMFPLSIKPKRLRSSAPPLDDWAAKPLIDEDLEPSTRSDAEPPPSRP